MHDAQVVANYGSIETFTFVWHCIVNILTWNSHIPSAIPDLGSFENSPEITK